MKALKKPQRIGFVVKHHHPRARQMAIELAADLVKQGITVLFATESTEIAEAAGERAPPSSKKGEEGNPPGKSHHRR